MMFRRFLAACAACAFAAAGVAIAPQPTAAADMPTILFGSMVSLTGPLAKEGHLTQEGYDFWADYVNAHGGIPVGKQHYKVQIKYYDDESVPQTAANLATRLLDDDHVQFILGPYGAANSFTVAQILERRHIPMVQGNGTSDKLENSGFTYTFGVLAPAKRYLEGIIEMALAQKPAPKTLAMTYASDSFSEGVAQGGVDYAKSRGMNVVYNNKYPADTSDVSAIVTAVKASNADVILNAGHLQDVLLEHRAFKDQNVLAKVYGYSVGPATPDFITTLGKDANGVYGASQWSDAVRYTGVAGFISKPREYADAFAAKYHHPADYHNADSTATCLAFQYALAAAGTLDPLKVRDALAHLDVMTFYGRIKFDSRGVNIYKPMIVEQIQDGHLVTVWPTSIAQARPKYPTPAWNSR